MRREQLPIRSDFKDLVSIIDYKKLIENQAKEVNRNVNNMNTDKPVQYSKKKNYNRRSMG